MTISDNHADTLQRPIRYGGAETAERALGPSVLRGLKCTCPHCGEGRLFRGFLKPVDHCAVCGEEFTHHRADDLPPYLVIFIIGHVTVGGFMMTEKVWSLSMWAHLAIWVPITILMSLALMQPIKGAVIGLQWAMRMHGFGQEDESRDPGRGDPIE
ncbi:DUF983 domain-containing protein [Rhizobium sp. SSA_523]|uniref:DUF983 domain-containing protein n=1 Tax=Rhizobium sp. SSA_523 TaxID=2952477 RepID=UPI0020906258|nr:DUF983 domain-containing protein [Rhizobium sp. SSA_523]MCO5730617.1 DUF983 domain-containing protein [Rhizobium sp. SSA_523]WKC24552.1 DUF983 domain-containing protein [Rhizobium sp. SSA_523]